MCIHINSTYRHSNIPPNYIGGVRGTDPAHMENFRNTHEIKLNTQELNAGEKKRGRAE